MSKPFHKVTDLVSAILGNVSQASFDDVSVSDLTNPAHWPDWAVYAIAFRDIVVETGERVGPVRYYFYAEEAELRQWTVDTYINAMEQGGKVSREVTSYEWDWGPVLKGTRSIWVAPL